MPFESRNPDASAGVLFTPADDALIASMRSDLKPWLEIAALLGRKRCAVRARYDKIRHTYVPQVDPRARTRRCLSCSNDFPSAHAGNRLCGGCTEAAARVSPYEPEYAAL